MTDEGVFSLLVQHSAQMGLKLAEMRPKYGLHRLQTAQIKLIHAKNGPIRTQIGQNRPKWTQIGTNKAHIGQNIK